MSWQTRPAGSRSSVHYGDNSALVAEGKGLEISWDGDQLVSDTVRRSVVVDVPWI